MQLFKQIYFQVKHSAQRLHEKDDLKCWVAIDKENIVLTGHCTCMPDMAEVCSHTTALLFLVADRTDNINLTQSTSEVIYLNFLVSILKPSVWTGFMYWHISPMASTESVRRDKDGQNQKHGMGFQTEKKSVKFIVSRSTSPVDKRNRRNFESSTWLWSSQCYNDPTRTIRGTLSSKQCIIVEAQILGQPKDM